MGLPIPHPWTLCAFHYLSPGVFLSPTGGPVCPTVPNSVIWRLRGPTSPCCHQNSFCLASDVKHKIKGLPHTPPTALHVAHLYLMGAFEQQVLLSVSYNRAQKACRDGFLLSWKHLPKSITQSVTSASFTHPPKTKGDHDRTLICHPKAKCGNYSPIAP